MPVPAHAQVDIVGTEGKKVDSGLHTAGADAHVEPSTPSISPSIVVTSYVSPETQAPSVVDLGINPSPTPTVGEQILDSVRASMAQGDRQISVRLQPPELGMVTVRLREQDSHLEGTVEAGLSDTRREIERALPELIRGLQEVGIQIRRFDVTSGDSSGQDLGRGLPQQDVWSGPNGSSQGREHLPTPHVPWPQEAANYSVPAQEPADSGDQINVPPGRIDMLL